jgi:large subunit ribosomal protein L17
MRHLKAGRKLNRNASHRAALMRNLSCALIEHERIITTVAKAKALRPFIEKLITLAKKGTLHARRLAVARLHNKEAVAKLFKEIAPRFAERPGGYTRIIRRQERRLGDAGLTAYIELLREGERKTRTRATPPPAPRVSAPPPAPAPQAEAPKPEQPPAPEPTPPAGEQKPPENPPAS